MKENLEEYLHSLLPARNGEFAEMEEYAKEHQVPIMEPEGMEALLQILRLQKPERILEVGAAIGYSALRMSDALPGTKIVTIERDGERAQLARENIKKMGKQEDITLIEGDALETGEEAGLYMYDAIFIDAAKGQYKRFFELYEAFLNRDGIIITDNVLFKGLVAENEEEIEPKRIRNLVRKIKDYNVWLMNHPEYHTVILPIGDGVAISKRK
ncbi:Predicted O-methyltransferase YrrM [Bacillus sp. OV322]|uniref:O-methyltransferase n=1 Tax=Bacillus sp. OV322 TaxID=1882764 RepID=UPI0008E48686|nr:O-methyltransferase [Bacillus sp. OV322]SFC36517.1 Predicted O-methyltransferase YrrM [Bacillus sp. OV322]